MDLFGTAGIRGPVSKTVTPELALAVGRAAGADGDSFVVARDGRETGASLASAVTSGLTSAGADVVRLGVLPTPALAYASRDRRGVMVTASHNPPADNGLKLFVDGREYDREAERRIERRVEEGSTTDWDDWGLVEQADPLDEYREAVVDYARGFGTAADGLTVAVDCGNGVGSLATPQVLTSLEADVRALNASVDGHFPARESKPTPESLVDLRAFVAGGADLGIGHDGDADRIVFVGSDGGVVHEDTVVAILAAHYTRASDAGDPVVVTTPNASGRIDEQVSTAGGRVERVRLGALHEGIAATREAAGPDTEVVFAAEPWKHVHTAFGGWIDGVASAAVFVRLVASDGLAALREPVAERPYRKESVRCSNDRKRAAMDRLESTLPEVFPDGSVDTKYGVRMELPGDAWTLVRPSGTEPYLRVYAESDEVDALVDEVTDVVARAVAAVE